MFCIMYLGKGHFVEKSQRWLPTELLYTSNVAPTPINSLLLSHSDTIGIFIMSFWNAQNLDFHRKFVKFCQILYLWKAGSLVLHKNIGKEGCVEKPQLIACWTAARITSRSNTHQLTVADVFTVRHPSIHYCSIIVIRSASSSWASEMLRIWIPPRIC